MKRVYLTPKVGITDIEASGLLAAQSNKIFGNGTKTGNLAESKEGITWEDSEE